MSNRLPFLATALLLIVLAGCTNPLPVQPTPDRIEDYFDEIIDEPDPITKYIDECVYVVPADIFVDQVYYSYDPVRDAIPKSLITRGTDGSVTNGEIVEVYISCDTDIAVFLIQTDSAAYLYMDFFGVMHLSASEAQEIRDALLDFVPKRR